MNINEINKIKKSESNRRAVVTGLGAGLMSFAFFGRKLKNADTNIKTKNIETKEINVEIHPSAIKRNEG